MSSRVPTGEWLDFDAVRREFRELGLPGASAAIAPLVRARLGKSGHGDFDRWAQIVAGLGEIRGRAEDLKAALLGLAPWRKGPFSCAGITIDAEWRSDWKWARLEGAIAPLDGRKILDVGCGNGYYALQMRHAGAAFVLGIDPTLLYVMQFLAIQRLQPVDCVRVLPLRLHELSAPGVFDTTFSMGVLYHQRSPLDHLRQLRETLRPGGQLVLETLILPGNDARAVTPPGRYANMKNVWLLPTVSELTTWLKRSAYQDIRIIDETVTTTDEQRRTEWMSFASLEDALDPRNPTLTIEGWPAPRRAILLATAQ